MLWGATHCSFNRASPGLLGVILCTEIPNVSKRGNLLFSMSDFSPGNPQTKSVLDYVEHLQQVVKMFKTVMTLV